MVKVNGYFSCVPILCLRSVGLEMTVLEMEQSAPSPEQSSAVSGGKTETVPSLE